MPSNRNAKTRRVTFTEDTKLLRQGNAKGEYTPVDGESQRRFFGFLAPPGGEVITIFPGISKA
jgi:hypothetical protein